jgi:hypothetical protein
MMRCPSSLSAGIFEAELVATGADELVLVGATVEVAAA